MEAAESSMGGDPDGANCRSMLAPSQQLIHCPAKAWCSRCRPTSKLPWGQSKSLRESSTSVCTGSFAGRSTHTRRWWGGRPV